MNQPSLADHLETLSPAILEIHEQIQEIKRNLWSPPGIPDSTPLMRAFNKFNNDFIELRCRLDSEYHKIVPASMTHRNIYYTPSPTLSHAHRQHL